MTEPLDPGPDPTEPSPAPPEQPSVPWASPSPTAPEQPAVLWAAPSPAPVASTTKFCSACGAQLDARAEICPTCGVRQPLMAQGPGKSRVVAALLALFLGWLGIHKFYLGKTVLGVIYLIFFWTGIPGLIAWVEAMVYLATSDESWAQKHGGPVEKSNGVAIGCLWVLALLPLLSIFVLTVLIFLGSQVSSILSTTATSSASFAAVAATPAPAGATPAPSRSPERSIAPVPSVSTSDLPSACLPLPHDAPDVEPVVPATVAGRPLMIWSVHGERMVTCVGGGTASDVTDLAATLATEGLGLDDISVVIAGRSQDADPPYFVLAYKLDGHPGSEWPSTVGLDHRDAAAFHKADLGGKHVLVGETAAMDQSTHARGKPYVWDSPTVHYLIITDDAAWATEVLGKLK